MRRKSRTILMLAGYLNDEVEDGRNARRIGRQRIDQLEEELSAAKAREEALRQDLEESTRHRNEALGRRMDAEQMQACAEGREQDLRAEVERLRSEIDAGISPDEVEMAREHGRLKGEVRAAEAAMAAAARIVEACIDESPTCGHKEALRQAVKILTREEEGGTEESQGWRRTALDLKDQASRAVDMLGAVLEGEEVEASRTIVEEAITTLTGRESSGSEPTGTKRDECPCSRCVPMAEHEAVKGKLEEAREALRVGSKDVNSAEEVIARYERSAQGDREARSRLETQLEEALDRNIAMARQRIDLRRLAGCLTGQRIEDRIGQLAAGHLTGEKPARPEPEGSGEGPMSPEAISAVAYRRMEEERDGAQTETARLEDELRDVRAELEQVRQEAVRPASLWKEAHDERLRERDEARAATLEAEGRVRTLGEQIAGLQRRESDLASDHKTAIEERRKAQDRADALQGIIGHAVEELGNVHHTRSHDENRASAQKARVMLGDEALLARMEGPHTILDEIRLKVGADTWDRIIPAIDDLQENAARYDDEVAEHAEIRELIGIDPESSILDGVREMVAYLGDVQKDRASWEANAKDRMAAEAALKSRLEEAAKILGQDLGDVSRLPEIRQTLAILKEDEQPRD